MRLIDADKINFKWINGVICVEQKDIRKASTVDAVPVIRCKDCRWHWRVTESRVSGYCENDKCFDGFHFETDNDFYCGYAERKEE